MRISDWSSDVCSSDLAGWLHAASEVRRRAARGGAIRCFMDVKLAAAARARNVRGSTPESGIFAWVLPPSTLYNRYDGHPRKYGAGRARQPAQNQRLWRRFEQGSEGPRTGAQTAGPVYRRDRRPVGTAQQRGRGFGQGDTRGRTGTVPPTRT